MKTNEGKVALITGASSGIGRALALVLAEKGYDVAIFARRLDRLDALEEQIRTETGRQILSVSCDIRDSEAMDMNIGEVITKMGRLDLVVANAGFTIPGAFENLTVQDYKHIFDTNFHGMLNTLYPAYPALLKHKGTIVIVGSILGEFGIMDRSAYVATKFALRGFYESVRFEFREKGIAFLFVEPGFVKTELRYMDKTGNRLEDVSAGAKKKTSHGIAVEPDKVARLIVNALPKSGYRKRIVTGHAKVFASLNWLCPGLLNGFIYKKREIIRKKVVK